MKREYWDALARDFSSQVLEITECDVAGVVAKTAKRLGGRRKTATDFGCGAGAVTRMAAPFYKSVVGVDFSKELLKEARRRTRAANVSYEFANLQAERGPRFPCDVAFCVNVLIAANADRRDRIARNVVASAVRGGSAVFVVPSLESVLRVYQVALQCHLDEGFRRPAAALEVNRWVEEEIVSLPEGIVKIGGAPTKLYLRDELAELLRRHGLRDVTLERISYPWAEALENAPRGLNAAPPWDWMAVGVKP